MKHNVPSTDFRATETSPHAPWRFFGWVFALSAPLWLLGSIVDITGISPFGISLSTLMVFVPVIAAAVCRYRDAGWEGTREWLAHAWRAPRDIGIAATATIAWPLLTMAAFAVAWLGGLAPWPDRTESLTALAGYTAVFVVLAACEEWGWTGYATDPLLRRFGELNTGLILGTACTAWHVVALLQMGRGPVWIVGWILGTVAMRVLMVRAYVATGRGLSTVIGMHASVNVCFVAATASTTTHNQLIVGVLAVITAVVVVRASAVNRAPHRPM